MTPADRSGWSEAELYVTKELERLSAQLAGLDNKVTELRVEVAQKGALWGAIAGIASAIGLRVFT